MTDLGPACGYEGEHYHAPGYDPACGMCEDQRNGARLFTAAQEVIDHYQGVDVVGQIADAAYAEEIAAFGKAAELQAGTPLHAVVYTGSSVAEVDLVNHPPHYSSHPSGIEAIRLCRLMSFDWGNPTKYVLRAPHKGSEHQDYDKARWYVEDAVRHAAPIWLPGKTDEGVRILDRVVQFEDDPNRIRFFRSMRYGARHAALEAIQDLLRQV